MTWTPDEIALESPDTCAEAEMRAAQRLNRLLLAVVVAICTLGMALIKFASSRSH